MKSLFSKFVCITALALAPALEAQAQDTQQGKPKPAAAASTSQAEGDKVIMVVNWSGTHKGDFMGAKATGKKVTTRTADVIRIENGKIAEHWDVVADQDMWEKLGFMKMNPPKAPKH